MLRPCRPTTLTTAALALAFGLGLACTGPDEGSSGLEASIPQAVAGWQASEPVAVWDTETIFDYIDGHAEVYLAYGMKRSLSRRYGGPEGEADIVLDLFELASPDDAYGVFTHDLDGVPVGVGNGSRLRYGWLSFWQGAWFVSVSSEMESDRANQAVLDLGQAIASLLPAGGSAKPAVVEALPVEGLDASSVRFLRHPNILNTHYWLGDENVFGLGPETAAALGEYDFEGTRAYVLIVEYEGEREALAALDSFFERFIVDTDGDYLYEVEDRGWFGGQGSGSRIVAVLGADSRELAEWLLSEAIGGVS